MISLDNARRWTKDAAAKRTAKSLEKWIVRVGDDWVQTFRDKMTQAMVDAVRSGSYSASVEISSPDFRSSKQRDGWQAFICPGLEKLLQEYEALGFQDGAMEEAGITYNTIYTADYYVTVNWGYQQRRPGCERIRYA